MKTISVRDLQKQIRSVMETAQNDQVVITRNGQPLAVVVGVEGADWETVAVETSRSSGRRSPSAATRRRSPSPRSENGSGHSPPSRPGPKSLGQRPGRELPRRFVRNESGSSVKLASSVMKS